MLDVSQEAGDAGAKFAWKVFGVWDPFRAGEQLFGVPWRVGLVGEEHTDVYVSPEAFDSFIDCFLWGRSPWLETKIQAKAKKSSKFLGWLMNCAEVVAGQVTGLG